MQLIRSAAFLTSDAAASEASAADFAAATRGQHNSDNGNESAKLFKDEVQSS